MEINKYKYMLARLKNIRKILKKKDLSIKEKIIQLFIIYFLIVAIFGYVYWFIYLYKPNYFYFNSEIRTTHINSSKESLVSELKQGYRNEVKKLSPPDTIYQADKKIVTRHNLEYRYIIGQDTLLITDSNQIPLRVKQFLDISENSGYNPIWGYFDFLYFSTITMSTVGYGDILPNSTLVRMMVVIEVVIGQILLIVLLNIILIGYTKKKEKDNFSEKSSV